MSSKRQGRQRRVPLKSREARPPEKLSVLEARKFLGVSASKMTELLSSGLAWESDPLNRRVKLIRRADLEALLDRRNQH
jgi:hypothetical protein